MQDLERAQLEFFADVAQLDDPHTLSPGERLLLSERFEHLFPEARTDPVDPIRQLELNIPEEATKEEVLWARLLHLKELTKSRILEVLDGGTVTIRKSFNWSAAKNRWVPAEMLQLEGRYNNVLFHLTEPPTPFRFRRCPHCQRIFVPRRTNMKFCTGDCTRSANERARRDAKRDWNREYMRKRRDAEKEDV